MSDQDQNTREVLEELLQRQKIALDECAKRTAILNSSCRKYREALNKIAHPASWGADPADYLNIAKQALKIGK